MEFKFDKQKQRKIEAFRKIIQTHKDTRVLVPVLQKAQRFGIFQLRCCS